MAPESDSPTRTAAYTVRQVARMSGVSVRTLHFYDEVGLLKPAYQTAKGYRFYEEAQLLTLQQILFYRELGFELKQIKSILGRPEFEKRKALMAQREVLEETLSRTRTLLETIDKTTEHEHWRHQLLAARDLHRRHRSTTLYLARSLQRS